MGVQLSTRADPIYMMGRTDAETQRLIQQSRFYNRSTRRLLAEAGITAGMKVLDVGSGAGDVALLVADQVGTSGTVVGVDTNPAILTTARARASAAGFSNVTFLEGDIRAVELGDDFDAVVGRLVLMYQSDPAEVVRSLVRHLRPGGVVAFQDFNLRPDSVVCYPSMPLGEQVVGWMLEVMRRAGVETEMGYKLHNAFLAAGLPAPRMHVESSLGGGPDWDGYDYAAATMRSMLPLARQFGIATADEIAIDTLADRLRAEAIVHGSIIKLPDLVSAWARVS